MCAAWLTWRDAMHRALYGAGGFYRDAEVPASHFRTSVHVSTGFAAALVPLLTEVDAALGHPDALDVIDVGAGGGELLAQLRAQAPPTLTERLRPVAVEVTAPPETLPPEIAWRPTLPPQITGFVIANEWLDDIAVDAVERTEEGLRLLVVDPATGADQAGGIPSAADFAWLEAWWPVGAVGERAEIGRPRDEAWADVVRRLRRGVAMAVDYAHSRVSRPAYGTLAGYRAGRMVPAVPDGSRDVTAHVALDACAAAGEHAGARDTVLTTQRDALRALGVRAERPPIALARTEPQTYIRRLSAASEDGELLEPAGLGGFGWLAQAVGVPVPGPLRSLV